MGVGEAAGQACIAHWLWALAVGTRKDALHRQEPMPLPRVSHMWACLACAAHARLPLFVTCLRGSGLPAASLRQVPLLPWCSTQSTAPTPALCHDARASRCAPLPRPPPPKPVWHPQHQVSNGVRAEVAALTEIPYVKGYRARLLYKAGLRTPEAVAGVEEDKLLEILMQGEG